jgi:hypothetical protein
MKTVDWKASCEKLKKTYAAEKHELVKSVARLTAENKDLLEENNHLKNLAVKSYERFLDSGSEIGHKFPATPSSSRQSENGNIAGNDSIEEQKIRKTRKIDHYPIAVDQVPDGEVKEPDVSIK